MEKKLAEVYSAVFGYSLCDIADCSLLLAANRLSRTVLYVSDVTQINLTRQVLIDALNERSKKENPVKVSASDSTVNHTKTIEICQSKSETHQAIELPALRLCITPKIPSDTVISALVKSVTKSGEKISTEKIRNQLDNFGLSGTRHVEKRLTSILSILSPAVKTDDLSEILHTARQIFDVIAERSPTSSTTRTSNNSQRFLNFVRFSVQYKFHYTVLSFRRKSL